MGVEDQQRLLQSQSSSSQPNDKTNQLQPLTIEALEAHDSRQSGTGPCQLRQFGCPLCRHSWWHNVLSSKPVSRCRGEKCGHQRYNALPRSMEFGIGRFLCPNGLCGRRFFGYCEAKDRLQCRKCGSHARPYIHPKWRKRRTVGPRLDPSAKAFYPRQTTPPALYNTTNNSSQHALPPRLSSGVVERRSARPRAARLTRPLSRLSLEGGGSGGGGGREGSGGGVSRGGVVDLICKSHSLETDSASSVVTNDIVSQCSSTTSLQSCSSFTSQRSYASVVSQSTSTATITSGSNSPRNSLIHSPHSPRQPKVQPRPRRRIFNASSVHQPTGGTISTFLTQLDFEVVGEEVDLDYDSDDHEDKVGPCRFECSSCEKEYVVVCRMADTARCYSCRQVNRPLSWVTGTTRLPGGER